MSNKVDLQSSNFQNLPKNINFDRKVTLDSINNDVYLTIEDLRPLANV